MDRTPGAIMTSLGRAYPDAWIGNTLLEIKTTGGAINWLQAAKFAEELAERGGGATYMFLVKPTLAEGRRLNEIFKAKNVDLVINTVFDH